MGRFDGIHRDPKTGVTIARRDKHPLAGLFKAIPSGAGEIPINIPDELHHLLAIHIFDNLRCSPPNQPLYKYRQSAVNPEAGMNGGLWVPIDAPDEEFAPAGPNADLPVPAEEINMWTPEKMAAMKTAMRAKEIRDKLAEGADPTGDPVPPVPAASEDLPGDVS